MQQHLVSKSLPPKLQGDSLGSLTLVVKEFNIFNANTGSGTGKSTSTTTDDSNIVINTCDNPNTSASASASTGVCATTSAIQKNLMCQCRISFWGQEEQYFDINSNRFSKHGDDNDNDNDIDHFVSIQYPLIGSMEGIQRYFYDMNILPLPIFQTTNASTNMSTSTSSNAETNDNVTAGRVTLVGQGNVKLPDVWRQLQNSMSRSTTHRSTNTRNSRGGSKVPAKAPHLQSNTCTSSTCVRIPLISIPNTRKELKHPFGFQCQQIGDMLIDFVLSIDHFEMTAWIGNESGGAGGDSHRDEASLSVACKRIDIDTATPVVTSANDHVEHVHEDQIIAIVNNVERSPSARSSSSSNSYGSDSNRDRDRDRPKEAVRQKSTMEEINSSTRDMTRHAECQSLTKHIPREVMTTVTAKSSGCANSCIRTGIGTSTGTGTRTRTRTHNFKQSMPASIRNALRNEFQEDDDDDFTLDTIDDSILMEAMFDGYQFSSFSQRQTMMRPQQHQRQRTKTHQRLNSAALFRARSPRSRSRSRSERIPLSPDLCPSKPIDILVQDLERNSSVSQDIISTRTRNTNSNSMDLIEDTIISQVSAKNFGESNSSVSYHVNACASTRVNNQPEMSSGIVERQQANICTDKSSEPLWMYLSLGRLRNICTHNENKDVPRKFSHILVKASYECARNQSLSTQNTRATVYTEHIIKVDQSNGNKDWVWTTMLNIDNAKKNGNFTVNAEIWSHRSFNEMQKQKVSAKRQGTMLGFVIIPIQTPVQIVPSLGIPDFVQHYAVEVQDTNMSNEVDLSLSVGLQRQVRSFASFMQSATVIQQWWKHTRLLYVKSGRGTSDNISSEVFASTASNHFEEALLIQGFWRRNKRNITKKCIDPNHLQNKESYPSSSIHYSHSEGTLFNTEQDPSLQTNPIIASKEDSIEEDKCELSDLLHRKNGRSIISNESSEACEETENIKKDRYDLSLLSTQEIVLSFGECSGIREMISLWADNATLDSLKIPFAFDEDNWASSGVIVTFCLPGRRSAASSATGYVEEIVNFSSTISRMETRRHSVRLSDEFSVLLDQTSETHSYFQTERLVCKLWFIPTVTDAMMKQYPVSSAKKVTVPVEAHFICFTSCPLTKVLSEKCDPISYVCPWTYAHSQSFEHVIGNVRIDIGMKGSTFHGSLDPINLCPKPECLDRDPSYYPDIFDWNLPDKIEASISNQKETRDMIAASTSIPSFKNAETYISGHSKESFIETEALPYAQLARGEDQHKSIPNHTSRSTKKCGDVTDLQDGNNDNRSDTRNFETKRVPPEHHTCTPDCKIGITGPATLQTSVAPPKAIEDIYTHPIKMDDDRSDDIFCGGTRDEAKDSLSEYSSYEKRTKQKHNFAGESKHSDSVSTRRIKEIKKPSGVKHPCTDTRPCPDRCDNKTFDDFSDDSDSVFKSKKITSTVGPKYCNRTSFSSTSSSDTGFVPRNLMQIRRRELVANSLCENSDSSSSNSSPAIGFHDLRRRDSRQTKFWQRGRSDSSVDSDSGSNISWPINYKTRPTKCTNTSESDSDSDSDW